MPGRPTIPEHQAAERLVEDLAGSLLELDPQRWRVKAKVLLENVQHHIEEEEDELFEMASEALDDETLSTMAVQFVEQIRRAEAEDDRKARIVPSHAELPEARRRGGISGRRPGRLPGRRLQCWRRHP